MPSPESYCYCWRDDAKKIAVVFVGDAKETDRRWQARNEFESDANLWLRTLDKPPEPGDGSILWPDFGNRMRTMARLLTAQLTEQGYDVLSLRDRGSYAGGRKRKKPVYVWANGQRHWFTGLRACARALGLTHTTVLDHINNPKRPDFRWADEVDKER